ncbi:MAG: 3'-5' exonuclease, partial [Planctomycetota bacterium]
LMTNFSAVRFNGGLNAAAKIIGRPGKMDVKGDEVQELYDAGELSTISDYCRSDVLDTYFVFLRCMVLTGKLPLKQEQHLVHETEQWLAEQSDAIPAYANYLARCKPFQDPFQQAAD